MNRQIQQFRTRISPTIIIGATALALLMVVMIARLNVAASQSTDTSGAAPKVLDSQTSNTEAQVQTESASNDMTNSEVTDTEESSSVSSSTNSSGTVTVDGTTYTVPENGEFHHSETTDDGSRSVDISVQSSGSGDSSSSSRSTIRYNSESSTSSHTSESSSQ